MTWLGYTQLLQGSWDSENAAAMKRCMEEVYKARIRIQDFFHDFDPLRR